MYIHLYTNMFNTPQSQYVAQYMMNNYLRGIKQDIAFETGDQQPYYLPTAMRLGPVGSSVVDGSFRYKEMSGGVLQNNLAGSGMSGCGIDNMRRFVGGQGIRSLNGVEPSKAAGTQSYTTAKMDGSYSGSGVVSQDLAFGLSGSMEPLSIPKQDQEPESLAGVRRVHGGRRKMTIEEKKKWAEMMKQARMKKRGGKKSEIHIDINSHKNEPKNGGQKEIHVDINSHKNEPNDDEKDKKKSGKGAVFSRRRAPVLPTADISITTREQLDRMNDRRRRAIRARDAVPSIPEHSRGVSESIATPRVPEDDIVLHSGRVEPVRGVALQYRTSLPMAVPPPALSQSGVVPQIYDSYESSDDETVRMKPMSVATLESSKLGKGRKKVWTQEERKAFAEKMKAAKAKKRGSGAVGTSVGGMKKHIKRGGAIQPVNTFTSNSSPKIGGMKQDVKSKLIEVLRNKK